MMEGDNESFEDKNKPIAVIFDVDGTLCDVSSIRYLVEGKKKDFDLFHKKSFHCPPNSIVAEETRRLRQNGLSIVVVSGRKSRYLDITMQWLIKNVIPYQMVLLRDDNDYRSDVEVKRDMLIKLRKHYQIIHAWDDRPSVIDMWESEGIPVTKIAYQSGENK